MSKHYKALVVSEREDGKYQREIKELSVDNLPEGNVLVRVHYSSLNYKDALSATGNKGVTRKYPHTPGIDAAGVVEESSSSFFNEGDEVIVTSYDLGMNTPGGFGEYIRVPEDWIVKCPGNLSLKNAMMYGTAGFTAGLSVYRLLEAGITSRHGDVLVTGASGGVGSIAVTMLKKEGFNVVAMNGRKDETDYLQSLGADKVVNPEDVIPSFPRPMLKELWAGCVDTVGGDILASAIKSTKQSGVVTCCGNAASHILSLNVYPFILRGITLTGIDSQNCSMVLRKTIWEIISTRWSKFDISQLVTEITLDMLDERIEQMMSGKTRGRTIVKMV